MPNKSTTLLAKTLEELGQVLPERISEILPSLRPEKQIEVYLELMQYVFPKRKAIEHQTLSAPSEPQIILTLPRNGREVDQP